MPIVIRRQSSLNIGLCFIINGPSFRFYFFIFYLGLYCFLLPVYFTVHFLSEIIIPCSCPILSFSFSFVSLLVPNARFWFVYFGLVFNIIFPKTLRFSDTEVKSKGIYWRKEMMIILELTKLCLFGQCLFHFEILFRCSLFQCSCCFLFIKLYFWFSLSLAWKFSWLYWQNKMKIRLNNNKKSFHLTVCPLLVMFGCQTNKLFLHFSSRNTTPWDILFRNTSTHTRPRLSILLLTHTPTRLIVKSN